MTQLPRRAWLRRTIGLAACAAGAALGGPVIKNASHKTSSDPVKALLRPPGAGPAANFLTACIRCGQCIEACPFDSLISAGPLAGLSSGTPYVNARAMPCKLCEGEDLLLCIDVCPTDALTLPHAEGEEPGGVVDQIYNIRMGVARIDTDLCMAWQDQVCRACWHACPFPDDAIELDRMGRAFINEDSCIGCGLCDWACLTEPSSILMIPEDARQRDQANAVEG